MAGRSISHQLRRHRLTQGWSFQELAEAIEAVTGRRLAKGTLIRFMREDWAPHELTTHVIETYLQRADKAPKGAR